MVHHYNLDIVDQVCPIAKIDILGEAGIDLVYRVENLRAVVKALWKHLEKGNQLLYSINVHRYHGDQVCVIKGTHSSPELGVQSLSVKSAGLHLDCVIAKEPKNETLDHIYSSCGCVNWCTRLLCKSLCVG